MKNQAIKEYEWLVGDEIVTTSTPTLTITQDMIDGNVIKPVRLLTPITVTNTKDSIPPVVKDKPYYLKFNKSKY